MREWKYNWTMVFLLIGLFCITSAMAGEPKTEYSKSLKREFSTTRDGKVELSNKYGKVKVNTWSENKVKVEVTITVNAKSEEEAEQGFDRISVNFMNMVGHVKVETVIRNNQSKSWWGGWSNGNSCQDFSINYVVWMPKSNDLNLVNKYGDSDLASIDGRVEASIKYGNFNAENLNEEARITIGYGKARIERAEDLESRVSYGELMVKSCHDMELDSKYSEVEIENARRVNWDSRYDDFKLGDIEDLRLNVAYSDGKMGHLGSMEIEADYTDIRVKSIAEDLDADLDYSDLRIDLVSPDFSKIYLKSDYSDFTFGANSAFSFDVETSYTDVFIDPEAKYSQQKKDGIRKRLVGNVGNGGGVVKARMTYGDLRIKN